MADLLRFAKCSAQFVLGPLKEPFLCQHEVDHSIASWHLLGWIRFQHLFVTVPAYLSKTFFGSWYPGLDAEGGPFKSSPNARRYIRFWYRPLCSAVAMWEMSIFATWSRYRTQGINPSMGHLGLLFFVNRLPICPTLMHILVWSFSNNLSEHLLLWHGVLLRCRLNGRLYY